MLHDGLVPAEVVRVRQPDGRLRFYRAAGCVYRCCRGCADVRNCYSCCGMHRYSDTERRLKTALVRVGGSTCAPDDVGVRRCYHPAPSSTCKMRSVYFKLHLRKFYLFENAMTLSEVSKPSTIVMAASICICACFRSLRYPRGGAACTFWRDHADVHHSDDGMPWCFHAPLRYTPTFTYHGFRFVSLTVSESAHRSTYTCSSPRVPMWPQHPTFGVCLRDGTPAGFIC